MYPSLNFQVKQQKGQVDIFDFVHFVQGKLKEHLDTVLEIVLLYESIHSFDILFSVH